MFCAISGNVPEQPVISTKSGALFEKRLIDKYVRETGKCPVTQESLTPEDLLPVRISKTVKARTAPASSIPGLLSLFHDEWDATMLEMHSLRQSLSSARQELSHALYQHDAACRVIGRLIKERDEARTALENYKPIAAAAAAAAEAPAAPAPAAADDAPAKKAKKVNTLPDEVVEELTSCNAALSATRKKRQIPDGLATADDIAGGRLIASNPVHKTTTSIVTIDSAPENNKIVATGGTDATVRVLDTESERLLATLEGHRKRVTGVQFLTPGALVSTSTDTTARIWRRDTSEQDSAGAYSCAATLKEKAEIAGVSVHPSRKYFATASADGSWSFYDAATASLLRRVADVPGCGEPFTAVSFHPDGMLLGTGTSEKVSGDKSKSMVRLWEVKSQTNVASFDGLPGPVHALSFSENGFYLATASDDGVQLWDLRKLRNFRTLQPYESSGQKERSACRTVAFDYSGLFLAVGGADARIYGQKQEWSVVKSYPDLPEKGVNALHWQGRDAKTLLVGAADHNLRLFGVVAAAPAEAMQE